MELAPTITPKPLPFPNRRETVRRDEDVWKNRRTEVLEALLMAVIHELRTPLTAARSLVEDLKDLEHLEVSIYEEGAKVEEATTPGQLTMKQLTGKEAQAVYLDRLSKNIQRVMAVVEKWARLPVQVSDCHLNTLVEKELELWRAVTEHLRISIRCQGLENLPTVLAYEWRLSQVFSAIIMRAVFMTRPGGSVTVSGHVDQAQGTVRIDVEDTDPDVTKEFGEAFNRGEELKGTGIPPFFGGGSAGLQQARKIAEIHGGRISLESSEGVGTKVSISFPVR